ncbi:glycosyltransferase family 31 protein, partial [Saccharata proteae CBS 121410]
CASVPGADDVLVVLRASATELYQKVPQQLLTLFRCTPHFRIFADVETDVGGHHVYDVLRNISAATMQSNEEFKVYERIKELRREGQRLEEIDGGESGKLDKWKFLPMLHQAYQARPKAKWFFFMEADTSVSWSNLLQLLNRLSPKRPLYFGAQIYVGQMGFADGGSGFVLSNAAMKKFVSQWTPAKQITWEGVVSRHAYGDEIVGEALLGAGVTIAPAFPMMQGESPATLDWTARHWCRPAITWHNMSSHEVDTMWKFQNAWISSKGWKTPYLLKDVFNAFVQPHLAADLDDWDNLSQDWNFQKPGAESLGERTPWYDLSESDQASVESFDSCRGACFERKDCVQFSYAPGQCRLGRVVRLG